MVISNTSYLILHDPVDFQFLQNELLIIFILYADKAGFAISDDAVVREDAKQEIVRRYYRTRCEYALGFVDKGTIKRVEEVMADLSVTIDIRSVVSAAQKAADEAGLRRLGVNLTSDAEYASKDLFQT